MGNALLFIKGNIARSVVKCLTTNSQTKMNVFRFSNNHCQYLLWYFSGENMVKLSVILINSLIFNK